MKKILSHWYNPVVIASNNFKYKSLSSWSCNLTVGCEHGCTFCYVPAASTNKLKLPLRTHGVMDPDRDWGQYVLVREWDERKFMASLAVAEHTRFINLRPDGNRAVMFCTTTDPYQVLDADAVMRDKLSRNLRRALELIRDHSSINVRILTRSPLARVDFDLMKTFGKRLLFGMSLPTLDNRMARVYEPNAPAPTQRLAALQAAREAGLYIYVAVAPVYPECDRDDMERTLTAVRDLNPLTIFMEPINIRADNVGRIKKRANALGIHLNADVYNGKEAWQDYAYRQLHEFADVAADLGLFSRLHLWPDRDVFFKMLKFDHLKSEAQWFNQWWNRISEWPK